MLLVAAAGAGAVPARTDNALLFDSSHLHLNFTLSYTGNEAKNVRTAADINPKNNAVSVAEAQSYLSGLQTTALSQSVNRTLWDGNATQWTNLTVGAEHLDQGTLTGPLSVEYDGDIALASLAGQNHTLLIQDSGTAYGGYSLALSVPTDWFITDVTGLNLTTLSNHTVEGSRVTSATIATVVLYQLPPAPPGDSTPPFVNPGPDRTVDAGVRTNLTATANDNDQTFPLGATLWWSFVYNGSAQNLSGIATSFQFWTLGSYVVTFSAMDRSGNIGFATFQIAVERPDKVAPSVDAGANRTATATVPTTLSGGATDNDPTFLSSGTFWWIIDYNGTSWNRSGASVDFTFFALGTFSARFFAMDPWGNLASSQTFITVYPPDLQAPAADAGSEVEVAYGTVVSFDAAATDHDPTFPQNGVYWWTFSYNGADVSLPGAHTIFRFSMEGIYIVTLHAQDYWGNIGTAARIVTVRPPDLTPPSVSLGPDLVAAPGVEVHFTATAADNDPAFPTGARLWWSMAYDGSVYNFTGLNFSFTFAILGTYTVSFTATDASGNRAEAALRVHVISPDVEAPAVLAGPDITAFNGSRVDLSGTATDNDPNFPAGALFSWRIEGEGVNVTLNADPASYVFDTPGNYSAIYIVRDGWGNEGRGVRHITVYAKEPDAGDGSNRPLATSATGFSSIPLLGLAGAAVLGAVALVALRRRREEPEATLPDPLSPGAAAAAAALATPRGPSYVVEGLLILYKDGRLIHHQASTGESAFEDPEVVGAMFTAVTEFIGDSFREQASLSRLSYGQNTIMIEGSAHLFGAAIVFGEPDEDLRETLRDTLRRAESAYTGVVERWNGDPSRFKGIEGFFAPVFAATSGLTRADVKASTMDRTVKLVSGTEHYKGYVRLRVAVVNQTPETIANATLTVVFNQNVLRLARVEPAGLAREGLTVHLGDVEPGERLGAIYYLDPQTCSTTNIEGMATYTDVQGAQHEVKMKPRREEVVCPVFFTAQHANPATMRRLVETSLFARDAKLFRVLSLPAKFGYSELFAVAREAIQRHHVVLVRNLATREPFDGKAWFYGQTKHSKSAVVIRVAASEERRMIEIFVAVDSPATLTGLLAEFNRSFTEMLATRGNGAKLEQVLDDSLKGMLTSDEFEGPGTVE